MPSYNVMVSECCFLSCPRVQRGSASTPSLFTAHTGALNPSTPLVLHKWQEKERDGGEKNGRMCLCQGLMRRAMPWIACSMGPPRSLGDVWRGSTSHWQETTQLHNISWFFFPPVLPSFLSVHCILIIFFSTTAGAHIQANEKWQLCTLFAIQHLPRPPVGPEEGELHSLTPTALALFLPTRLYKNCLLCLVIKIKKACI